MYVYVALANVTALLTDIYNVALWVPLYDFQLHLLHCNRGS